MPRFSIDSMSPFGSSSSSLTSAEPTTSVSSAKQKLAQDIVKAAQHNNLDTLTTHLFQSPSGCPVPAFSPTDPDYVPALGLAMLYAAHQDNAETIQLLLDLGVGADARPKREGWARSYDGELKWAVTEGCTPLMLAARRGNLKAVCALLAARDVSAPVLSARDAHSWTALLRACWNGKTDVVELLIDSGGAVVDETDSSGWTGLMRASWNGHIGAARAVLERGAKIDLPDHHGQTALHLACANAQARVVQLLLDWGANTETKDVRGATPLDLARSRSNREVVEILQDHYDGIIRAATEGPTPVPPRASLAAENVRPAVPEGSEPSQAKLASFFVEDGEQRESRTQSQPASATRSPAASAAAPAPASLHESEPALPGSFVDTSTASSPLRPAVYVLAESPTGEEPPAPSPVPVPVTKRVASADLIRAAEEGGAAASTTPSVLEEHEPLNSMEASTTIPGAFERRSRSPERNVDVAPAVEILAPQDTPTVETPTLEPAPETSETAADATIESLEFPCFHALLAHLAVEGAPPSAIVDRLQESKIALTDALVETQYKALEQILRSYCIRPFVVPADPSIPAVPPTNPTEIVVPEYVESLLETVLALRAKVERVQDEGNWVEDVQAIVRKFVFEAEAVKEETEVAAEAKRGEKEHLEEARGGAERDFQALTASLSSRMPATFDFSAFDRILEAAQTSASTAIQQHKADVETELGRLEARATSIETLCDAANFASEQLAEVHHGLHEETAGTLTKLQAFGVQAHSYLANLTALTELVLTKLRRKRNQLELDATEAARMGLASRYKRLVDVEGKELDREVAEGERLWRRYTDIMRELAGVTKEKDARKEVGERGKEYSQGSSKQGSEESTQPEVYPVEILSPMRSSGLPGSSSRPVQLLPLHIADSDDAGSAASVEDRNTQDSPVAAEPRMVDLNLHVEVALSAVDDEETQPYERAATEEEGSEAGLASLSEGSFERIEMEDVEALGL